MESVAKSLAAEKTRLSLMQMPVASTVQITVWGAETFLCLCSVMHRVFKDQRYRLINNKIQLIIIFILVRLL